MDNTHYISGELLSLENLEEIISHNKTLALSEEAKVNIQKCRDYLDKKMESHKEPIYGINTGFGSLYNIKISNDEKINSQNSEFENEGISTDKFVSSN